MHASASRFAVVLLAAAFLSSCATTSGADKPSKSLYERLGGMDAIKAVVDEFINVTAADPKVNQFFGNTDAAYLKGQISEMLCEVTGGPCKYTGMSMEDAHQDRKISGEHFDVVAGHLVATLDKLKVPEPEKKELLAIVAPLKDKIVQK